jgi:flagellar biosynthesis protein FlgN
MNDALLATVIDETSTVEAFASVLALETKALTAASPLEQLPPLVEQKTTLIGVLANLERSRDDELQKRGLPLGAKGMEAAARGDAKLAAQWSLLQKAADRARHTNTTNGELIRVRMEYNERALAVLQVVEPKKAGFYGPDGRVPGR